MSLFCTKFDSFIDDMLCIFCLPTQEIKEALIEERTDIMADPVLHEACQGSVAKHCADISHGRGRSNFFPIALYKEIICFKIMLIIQSA